MSIQSEINRIKTNLADAYTAAQEKGATMPSQQNSENLASTISSVSASGGSARRGFEINVTGGTAEEMTFTTNFTNLELLKAVVATENYSDLDIVVNIGNSIAIYKDETAVFRLKNFRYSTGVPNAADYVFFRGDFMDITAEESLLTTTYEFYCNLAWQPTLKKAHYT